MAAPDIVTWNEALPDNNTTAHLIDDFDRDLRQGVSARMRREHIWPTAQTATNEAGHHAYISFQSISSASVFAIIAGTTAGALYVGSSGAGYPFVFLNSAGTGITVVNSAGHIPIMSGGTFGSIVICSSASPTSVIRLTGSTDGLVLVTHAATAAPTWAQVSVGGAAIPSLFGAFVDCSAAAAYDNELAATDGFVIAYSAVGVENGGMSGFTDAASPPTTKVDFDDLRGAYTAGRGNVKVFFPVIKGERWKITLDNCTMSKCYWIPVGA